MKYIKLFEEYKRLPITQSQMGDIEDPAVGDIVYINYKIPGDKKSVITPVKIKSIKTRGVYIASHDVELSDFRNAPDLMIKKSDIIGPYKGVSTPVGPGWVTTKPSINTGVNQVSNDMYL
jgi:hypothetical protein